MYFILRHMQYAICNMQYISTSSTMEYLSTLTCNPNYSLQNHVNGPVFKNPTVPELYFIMLLLPKKIRIYTTKNIQKGNATRRKHGALQWLKHAQRMSSRVQEEALQRRHYRGSPERRTDGGRAVAPGREGGNLTRVTMKCKHITPGNKNTPRRHSRWSKMSHKR